MKYRNGLIAERRSRHKTLRLGLNVLVMLGLTFATQGCTESREGAKGERRAARHQHQGGKPDRPDRTDHLGKMLGMVDEKGPQTETALKTYLLELSAEEGWEAARQWARHLDRGAEGKWAEGAYHDLLMVHHYAVFKGGDRAIGADALARSLRDIQDSGQAALWRLFLMHGLMGQWDVSTVTVSQRFQIIGAYLALAKSDTETEQVREKAVEDLCPHLDAIRGTATQEEKLKLAATAEEVEQLAHALVTKRSTPPGLKVTALTTYATVISWPTPPRTVDAELLRTVARSHADFPELHWPELLRTCLGVLPAAEVRSLAKEMLSTVGDKNVEHQLRVLSASPPDDRTSGNREHSQPPMDGEVRAAPAMGHAAKLIELSGDTSLPLGDLARQYLRGLDREAGWQAVHDWARHLEKRGRDAERGQSPTTVLLLLFEEAVLKGDDGNLTKADIDRAFRELAASKEMSLWRRFLLLYIADKWGERTTSPTEKMRIVDRLLELAGDRRDQPQLRAEALAKAVERLARIQESNEHVRHPTPALREEREATKKRIDRLVQLSKKLANGTASEPEMVVPGLATVVDAQFVFDLTKKETPGLVSSVVASYQRLPEKDWPLLIKAALLVVPRASLQDAYDGMRRAAKSKDTLRALGLAW